MQKIHGEHNIKILKTGYGCLFCATLRYFAKVISNQLSSWVSQPACLPLSGRLRADSGKPTCCAR